MKTEITELEVKRFWDKVDIRGPNDCWEWKASKLKDGYGQYRVKSLRTGAAHRISYIIEHGQIADGLQVCHKCDNPPCVNPAHLFAGTGSDNAIDAVKKGRRIGVRGDRNNFTKLTKENILEIRSLLSCGVFQKEIAAKYSIDQSAVSYIKSGKSWGWLCA